MEKTFSTQNTLEEKAILVGVIRSNGPKRYSEVLSELASLAETAEVEVLSRVTQTRRNFAPGTYIGKGKAQEIKLAGQELGANLIIFDDDLSPSQSRNLEEILEMRVIDRTELILHIFASHAKSKEAKLQVELAQLKYALPRLKRMWTHLDRHEGCIGTRGPGEKQLETDKRLIKKRIADLTDEIVKIQQHKQREVQARNKKYFTIGLIGYTNAGKSTLMNALTGADVLVEDKLFATLDTRTRAWEIDKRKPVLLSDTVGFINKLPHHLVASFKATLEEAAQSDILLHVVDVSHSDALHHIEVVQRVLRKIGLAEKTTLLVFNKLDQVQDNIDLAHLREQYSEHLMISAKSGENLTALRSKVIGLVETNMVDVQVTLPASNGKLQAWLEQYGRILERSLTDHSFQFNVRLSQSNANWLKQQAGVSVIF